MKKILPKGYFWHHQVASRSSKKGRASGGILLGITENWKEIDLEWEMTGVIAKKVKIDREVWIIVIIYRKHGTDEIYNYLQRLGEEQEGEYNMLIAGDFNSRMGREGGSVGWEGEVVERRSKDEVVNEDGRKLLGIAGENGWHILNGNKTGDEEGEYTYIGPRGATVIDYALANTRAWDSIKEMRVGARTESDHQPLIVELWHRRGEGRKEDKEEKRLISIWDVEAIDKYRKRLEEYKGKETEVNEMWREVKDMVDNSMEKREVKVGGKREEATWFDTECRRSKRQVGRTYKKFRAGKIDREGYLAVREKHRELCKRKKEKRKEDLIEEVKAIRSDKEAWNVINKYRKKRIRICNEYTEEEMEGVFYELVRR